MERLGRGQLLQWVDARRFHHARRRAALLHFRNLTTVQDRPFLSLSRLRLRAWRHLTWPRDRYGLDLPFPDSFRIASTARLER